MQLETALAKVAATSVAAVTTIHSFILKGNGFHVLPHPWTTHPSLQSPLFVLLLDYLILMTALAIASSSSHQRKCRVQLDTGAMLSLMSSKLAHTLGAKRPKNTALLISGVGGDLHSPHQVEFMLNSLRRTGSISVITSVVESIPECHTGGRCVTQRSAELQRSRSCGSGV